MKDKIFLSILIIFILLMGTLLIFTTKSYGASDLIPTASDNIQISVKSKSSLVAVDSGYMRVFYDSVNKYIGVEYYDDNFNILSKRKIDMELSVWGGFYAGKDAYYIVVGQTNKDEDDTAEVIRVIKYDKNWNRLGASKITRNEDPYTEVRFPFDYGSVEMTEVNGNLYIVTGHQGYYDSSVGQGHQGFLMIKVDENTLEGEIVDADLWHSFSQYIDYKDSNLYVLEQSEGSGITKLSKYDESTLKNSSITVLEYGGDRSSTWASECYASVDGIVLSENNILTIGTSIDQTQYDNVTSDTAHNIYLTITPMNNFSTDATTVKWLTNYADEGQCFTGLQITKINDNRFMVLWEEFETSQEMIDNDTLSANILHYIFIDGEGNKISQEYTAGATISDCQPIVNGSKIVYYASSDNMVDFYTIDVNTGALNKVIYRVAGENATWNLDDEGTLTISGTGDITIDAEPKYRYPISSTQKVFGVGLSDNTWQNVRDLVKKIDIQEGITSIPDKEFGQFNNLREVNLPTTMKTIGNEAFTYCDRLSEIVILDNITSIGEDAFFAGYYNPSTGENINYITIYTTEGSYAAQWAEQNNASYVTITKGDINQDRKVTLYDAFVMLRYVIFETTLTEAQQYIMDYNNDGEVGLYDAFQFLRQVILS